MKTAEIKEKLGKIRKAEELPALKTRLLWSAGFLALGLALGIFSKWLDDLAIDDSVWWQRVIGILDLGNVFSGFAVWFALALAIAVFSRTPLRAAVNVPLLFGGMCASYHIWTLRFSGFDPGSYMLIWYAITLLSPLFAIACWYAKGSSPMSIALCSLTLAVMSMSCFSVGLVYFYLNGVINALLFAAAVIILYKSPKQTAISVVCGIVLSIFLRPLLPFWI